MTNKFMFFENFKETADKLPDELRLKFYDAMTDYVFKGVEPDDVVVSALITAIKPSLDKVEKRGGNNNPNGNNQHKVGQSEVKNEVKEVKVGQSGQSFLETETRNKKQETENNSFERQIDLEDVIAEKKTAKKDFSAEFEKWWAKYPNKKSKQDALKSFNRVLKDKLATFDELMRGLEAYSNDCKAKNTETHYIKHPSTWLNQGCWADEYGVAEVEAYRSSVDTEKLNNLASIAELTKQRMAEQVKLKYGA